MAGTLASHLPFWKKTKKLETAAVEEPLPSRLAKIRSPELIHEHDDILLARAIGDLKVALIQDNPTKFGPSWIKARCLPVSEFVQGAVANGAIQGWDDVIGKLGIFWRARWSPVEDRTEYKKVISVEEKNQQRRERLVKKLSELLGRLQPDIIYPSWIEQASRSRYESILRAIRDSIFTSWGDVISKLDAKWQARWQPLRPSRKNTGQTDVAMAPAREPHQSIIDAQKEIRRKKIQERLIRKLFEFLDKLQPDFFSPVWLEQNSRTLYANISWAIRNGIFADWPDLLSHLDAKWQNKFRRLRNPRKDASATPIVIGRAGVPRGLMIDTIRKFDAANKNKDESSPAIDEEPPKQPTGYENAAEVDGVLEPYKKSLYLFLTAESKEDWHLCDEICAALLRLVKNGNSVAKIRLQELLTTAVHTWIEQYTELSVYTNDWQKVEQIMDSCFKNYNFEKSGSFTSYFRTTLRLRTRGLQNQVAQSLDQPIGESGRTLLEILPDTSTSDQVPEDESDE